MSRTDDQLEILDLIARYSIAVWEGDIDGWVAMWTDDGVLDGSLGRAAGPAELRALLVRMKGSIAGATRDFTCMTTVQVDGDTATSRSFNLTARTDGQPIVIATGLYTDALVRTPAGWRFRRWLLEVDANYDLSQVPTG